METWRLIPFAQNYEISDHGRVRRIVPASRGPKRTVPFIVKTQFPRQRGSDKGYEYVHLFVDGKNTVHQMHRLVMRVFVGDSGLQVNHKNGKKGDNRLSNLEYCTPSRNRWHAKNAIDAYTYGENHHNSKLNTAKVEAIHVLHQNNWTAEKIGKVVGCTGANVRVIIKGEGWAHIRPPDPLTAPKYRDL